MNLMLFILVEQHGVREDESHVRREIVQFSVLVRRELAFYRLEVHGLFHDGRIQRNIQRDVVYRFGKIKRELRLRLYGFEDVAPEGRVGVAPEGLDGLAHGELPAW